MNIALLRNKQLLALIIVALISFLIIATLVLGMVFHISILHFMPGKVFTNGYQ